MKGFAETVSVVDALTSHLPTTDPPQERIRSERVRERQLQEEMERQTPNEGVCHHEFEVLFFRIIR